MIRSGWLFILILLPVLSFAQAKRALNQIEKLRYEQAEELLYKSISTNEAAPGEKYVLSILLFTEDYQFYNVDSAHYYVLAALEDFEYADEKSLERLQKDEISKEDIINQKNRIEEFTFEQTLQINTEQGYSDYLSKYPTSLLRDSVVYHRNLVAFEIATRSDKWQDYQVFMEKYPESDQYEEAKSRFDKLIYEDRTRDGKLKSYESFLSEHPDTPYRNEVEAEIFRILTASNSTESYLDFGNRYPKSDLLRKASSRIYNIIQYNDQYDTYAPFVFKHLDEDSLKRLQELEQKSLFPILEEKLYNFLDRSGNRVFEHNFDDVYANYKCGDITESLLLVTKADENLILNRAGHVIFQDENISELEDLGNGFYKFRKGIRYGLLLKSGELIMSPSKNNIRILNGQYIAYQDEELWGITTVSGIQLFEPQFSDIQDLSGLIQIFDRKGNLFTLIQPIQLETVIDQGSLELEYRYDDLEQLDNGLILTYSGDKQSLITSELKTAIPEEEQELIQLDKGLLIEKKDGFSFVSTKIEINPTLKFEEVDFNSGWISLKGPNGWILASITSERIVTEYIDSIRLLNPSMALAFKNGIRNLYFNEGSNIRLTDKQLEVVTSPPINNESQSFYALIKGQRSKWLLSSKGDTLIVDYFSEVRAFGPEYLVVSGRNGSGLFDSQGNLLLKPEYDGIANYKDGGVTILNDGNLGFYRLSDKTFIPPDYSKSLQVYSDTLFIAYKDEGFGLISNKNRTVANFEYEDIKYFNDSLAWVKMDDTWNLLNIINKDIIEEDVSNYFPLNEDDHDFMFFNTSTGIGVLNMNSGTIINATFNNIKNVGSLKEPIFLAEKYIEEAEYYVIVYFDKTGSILYRQGYPADEYSKFTCEK